MKHLFLIISLFLLVGVVSADTLIIYPSSLGDGEYYRSRTNYTYSQLRDESSYGSSHQTYTTASMGTTQTVAAQQTDRFNTMEYAYVSLDTSSILANSTITSANWSIYSGGKSNALGNLKTLNWTRAVFANPADPSSGTYNNTFSSNVISTTINYADYTGRVYFDITPSEINKTGYTMMISRVNDHYANSFSGTWAVSSLSSIEMCTVDHAIVSTHPYMTITYDPSPIASFTPTGEITGITSVTQSFNSTSSNIESSIVFTAYNTSIIDLYAGAPAAGYTFATLRDQSVGTTANNLYTIGLVAGTTTNQFTRLTRVPLEFNTSDLPDDSSIINSYIGLTGYTGQSILLGDTNLGITGFNPTTNGSDVVGADYSKFDSTEMVINKSYSSWNAAGWNNFNLTTAGLDSISKTGWTNFFIRSDWDIYNNFTGTWKIGASNGTILSIRTSNYATVSERPTLTVNYFPTGTFAWGARNVTGNNTWISIGSTENITQTFGVGNWSVNLTVINQAGTANISTQNTWVNVSATTPPVASFTANTTGGTAPLSVLFNDTSTNTPTSWSWGAKNLTPGNNTWIQLGTTQNLTQIFGVGNWSINLTATNSGGTNTSTQNTWVNVSAASCPTGSVFTNGGFEYGNTTGWTNSGNFDNFATTSTLKHGGSYSLITYPYDAVHYFNQTADLTCGENITFYYYLGNYQQGITSMYYQLGNDAPVLFRTWDSLHPSTGYWTDVTIPTSPHTGNTPFAIIIDTNMGDPDIYFDDFGLTSVSPPSAGFTANNTIGYAPLTVQFNDTSTNTPSSWAWSYKNETVGWTVFSTSKNTTYTFPFGLYDINLTATNTYGYDTEVKNTYIGSGRAKILVNYSYNPSRSVYATESWSAMRNGIGTDILASNSSIIETYTTSNNFWVMGRYLFETPTQLLPDGATVSGATATLYIAEYVKTLGDSNISLIDASPISPEHSDYLDYSRTTFTRQAADSNKQSSGWVTFTISNLSYINTTGYTPYYLAITADVDNTSPTWSNTHRIQYRWYTESDGDNAPYMIINFTPTLPPVSSFTANTTGGTTLLYAGFNDTSTGVPTSWSWGRKNLTVTAWTQFSTVQNATQSFVQGNWSINLTATNAYGSNISTQVTWVNVSAVPDTTPPLSITGLTNTTATTCNSINWTWTKSASVDFNHTYVLKNNVFYANLSNTTTFSLWTGLTESTLYTISTKTVDITGNMNATWVNASYTLSACGVAPVASFTPNVTEGTANLPVLFTDTSTGSPTAWSWFFGDETYNQAWVQQNASSGWAVRALHSGVTLTDGSIVIMGGIGNGGVFLNDVWRSPDKGATWTLQNASSEWLVRFAPTSVSLSDGSIVLMGGEGDGGFFNDTWRSTDKGVTWTLQNASSDWTKRMRFSSVALPDGSIVIMGGADENAVFTNDVWRSTNKGVTWVRQTASAGWSERWGHTSVSLPDSSIVIMGGQDLDGFLNDTWRSTDKGVTWTLQNASSDWSARWYFSGVTQPDSSIVIMGGSEVDLVYLNDVWRSTDKGVTWVQQSASAEWSVREGAAAITLPDGSIVITGGSDAPGFLNDVWRFQPSGSTEQNPTHTYAAGNWSVHLTASNAVGYNNSVQNTWINVTSGVITPIVQWILDKSTVRVPGTVTVNDTSLNVPTSWEYYWGDGTSNTTTGNATHKYVKRGVYQVTLNATNSAGVNVSTSKQVRVQGYETYY